MGRIRSIKPEFPQSETMGRVSRDARLCFVMLWTIVDDSGRTRAASRMLASLLFPYDDDAPSLIDGWLGELQAAGCIRRYEVGGTHYLDIPNWLKHQKIDRPSTSRFPEFVESSRGFDEGSTMDLGSRIKDLGSRKTSTDASHQLSAAPPKRSVEDAFAAFNQLAGQIGLPAAVKLTPGRRSKIAARLKDHGNEGWQRALDRLAESPFLRGENDRHWRADIDFIVRPGKFTKLIEGGYGRHGAAQSDMLAEVMHNISEEIANGIDAAGRTNGQRPHFQPGSPRLAAPATSEGSPPTGGMVEGFHHGDRAVEPNRG